MFRFPRFILICCVVILYAGLSAAAAPVLSTTDQSTYRKIISAQSVGDIQTAKKLVLKLRDKRLLGYVLYDRYFSKYYKTTKSEITSWLKKYNELPVAADMYELGRQKKATLPKRRPRDIFGAGASGTCSAVVRPEPIDLLLGRDFKYLSLDRRKKAKKIMDQIYRYINRGKTLNARQLVESQEAVNLFSYTDHNAARTALAFSYFIDGEDERAIALIQQVLKHSSDEFPQAYWVGGLVSWRQEKYQDAARYFSAAADHQKTYPLLEASASVWAARSFLQSGMYERVGGYLEKAAKHQRLFYGILAMRMLARDLDHVWDEPPVPTDDVGANFSHPALTRFYALREIGRDDWAERELSKLYLEANSEAKGILRLISQQNGFDADLLAITGTMGDGNTRYPAPNWTPLDGWKVDKALVYAFVRQESCFNRRAESKVGALGLMQLMPDTARELAQKMKYPFQKNLLKQADYNLSLGQNYLLRLMDMPAIGNNLMFLAVGYNAGPGNLIKWKRQMNCDDPLLFLESIPSKETRNFVERIVVNYWIYRSLMGQPLASLDSVAKGDWPDYRTLDTVTRTAGE